MTKASDFTVTVDAGHGLNPATAGKRTPPIPELGGRVILEREFNEPTKNLLMQELRRIGFKVVDVAPELHDVPLSTRVTRSDNAKSNLHVSVHYNAFQGRWGTHGGIEVLSGSSNNSKRASADILKHLVAETGLRRRSVVDGSWLALNRMKSPLALAECGFMDNLQEALLMLEASHQRKCAVGMAKGVCDYFGVKYVSEVTPARPRQSKGDGIGTAVISVPTLNVRSGAGVNNNVVGTVSKGDHVDVYEIKNEWYRIGQGQWVSNVGNRYAVYTEKPPAPKPEPVVVHRVIVDGKQVGAFGDFANVVNAVELAHEKGFKKQVTIERV
ncbi:N-acetylmuramoyl-L-alanine amidase precursor [Bacillus phage vB_BpsS-36]|uniref:N-acetylmuramoyl-L-alanine amidase n=1 Tax=Bacillus phage vB_BpsS-36 TaxID=2419622 RepID=A0A3G3BWR1_9CAUD|nr:N-acetylmuramoyl-L-alanine amidase precursor [Bacillus phage vB_BpsS-36]